MSLSFLHSPPFQFNPNNHNNNNTNPHQFFITTINIKPSFQCSSITLQPQSTTTSLIFPISPSPFKLTPLHSKPNDNIDSNFQQNNHHNLLQLFSNSVTLLPSIFPGFKWWNLQESINGKHKSSSSSSTSVISALARIWPLVADDRLVIFTAFASLTIAALSEVTMPSLLATCIFAAQNGETLVFFRNSQLLMMLCLTSGICSGLRSCCFGIANTILVKRLRQTLYSVILFQKQLEI